MYALMHVTFKIEGSIHININKCFISYLKNKKKKKKSNTGIKYMIHYLVEIFFFSIKCIYQKYLSFFLVIKFPLFFNCKVNTQHYLYYI